MSEPVKLLNSELRELLDFLDESLERPTKAMARDAAPNEAAILLARVLIESEQERAGKNRGRSWARRNRP